MGQLSQSQDLGAGLKSRHVTMLSIAGVIGASLFVGSSVAIAEAGPAVLLAYLFAGLLVVMIMRMLAEMAVATPDTGSFSTYADKAIGRWAGYTIGWLYWWFWVLVIPLEANIAAIILHSWVPGVPVWLFSLVITLALTGSNLLSVKNYGEFEFWLALCKVIAILAFIVLGAVAITGFYPYAEVSGISRLWDHGGFMPNGFGAVLSAMLITMFSFMGAEIVTIAAAESDTPDNRSISGLSRCTEAKSRSASDWPEAIEEAAPPPRPMFIAGPPSTISFAPTVISPFCTCSPRMLPIPPASMIGLW